MDLSIIIVSYNTKDLLGACLRSIYNHPPMASFEIVVVDNASTDGSADMVKTEFPAVKTILNTVNAGFAAANNTGIHEAKGKLILLLNPDTEILKDAIQKTMKALRDYPSAGVMGCRLISPSGELQRSITRFPSLSTVCREALFLNKMAQNSAWYTGYSTEKTVDCVSGAFLLIKREVLDVVGLLDDKFFMYSEEVDFCYRASKAGYETRFFPDGEVIHHWHGVSALSARSRHWVLRSQILFLQKHFQGGEKSLIIFLKFTGILMRAVGYSVVGILLLNKASLKKGCYTAYAMMKILLHMPKYNHMSTRESMQSYFA